MPSNAPTTLSNFRECCCRLVNTPATFTGVCGLNINPETDYTEIFRDFPQLHQNFLEW